MMSMMTMFISYHAICAESCGQKVSLPPVGPTKEPKPKTNNGEGNSTPPECVSRPRQEQQQRQQRRPRFAPEFDGIHCFETIVPY
ncbi:hypothetical protein SLA2020_390170 [Shorea laevis]